MKFSFLDIARAWTIYSHTPPMISLFTAAPLQIYNVWRPW